MSFRRIWGGSGWVPQNLWEVSASVSGKNIPSTPCMPGILVQPITDRVEQNLEMISKNFSTNLISAHEIYNYYHVRKFTNDKSHEIPGMPGTKLKVSRNNLQILFHPVCNWLYVIHARSGEQKKISAKQTGPGRMTETPRAHMDDFACTSRCYWCSIVLICQGNFSMTGTFLISSLPPPDNHG